MTPDAYRGGSWPRRLLYRFCRTPGGVAFYYLTHIWAPRLVLPLPRFVERLRPVYALDSALVLAFLVLQVWSVTAFGGIFDKGPWESVLVGVVAPFLIWNGFMSFVIYLHHTHPAVKWYPSLAAWTADRGALQGAVAVHFPWPFGPLVLSIMEHNAHHLSPGVPLYNLPRMQRSLEAQGRLVSWRFTWRAYARVCRRCKLYDYDAGRWVAFNGRA